MSVSDPQEGEAQGPCIVGTSPDAHTTLLEGEGRFDRPHEHSSEPGEQRARISWDPPCLSSCSVYPRLTRLSLLWQRVLASPTPLSQPLGAVFSSRQPSSPLSLVHISCPGLFVIDGNIPTGWTQWLVVNTF